MKLLWYILYFDYFWVYIHAYFLKIFLAVKLKLKTCEILRALITLSNSTPNIISPGGILKRSTTYFIILNLSQKLSMWDMKQITLLLLFNLHYFGVSEVKHFTYFLKIEFFCFSFVLWFVGSEQSFMLLLFFFSFRDMYKFF